MSRQPVSMRQATIGDVPFLVELWSDVLRRADRQEQVHDLELIVKEAAASAEQRLLIAEYDGEPAGAVLLRVTPMTPLNLEPTVQALAPHVTQSYRGKGIGSALMEAAVLWAEDLGINHLTTAAPASSRSGNRFMARLSLGPQAVLRASTTPRSAPSWPRSSRPAPGSPTGWPAAATSARCWPRAARWSSAPTRTPAPPDVRPSPGPCARALGVVPARVGVTDGPARLLLLDGHSLAYRAFFALPLENFSTTTGQPTNAVFGFTSMLINVLRDERPTHIGVAFDVSRQTFRLEEYAEYKAGRNKTPGEFSSQLPLIEEVLAAMRIPFLKKEGYEADDIIATLVTQALADGSGIDDVLILTGDRDSIQLVTDRSTVLYPMRGVSDLARMTPAYVQDRYGIPPERYPELAALVGETSDNLPGVPGVGQGYAAKWINQYDGLDNVITHADEITGKKGEALREHLADVIRNRHLNALVTDLELEAGPTDLAWPSYDRQAVHTLFDGLEFAVLRTRLLEALPTEEEAAIDDSGFDVSMRVLDTGELSGWLADHASSGERVGIHPVGHWAAGTGDLLALAFATEEGAAYVTTDKLDVDDEEALADWLKDAVQAQGAPRRQGTDARLRGARDAARRPGARHRAVGVPRPSRPALLRPGRPDRPLPQARAAPGAGRRRAAQPGGSRR